MKKILPLMLILLGIAELIPVFFGKKMPLFITVALGVLFIALGVRALVDAAEKK